jgi:hypothetical protein
MEGGKSGQGMPTVVINGWGDKGHKGSSSDSASDQFLMKSQNSSNYMKAGVILAGLVVVIVTGIGLAMYFTMSRSLNKQVETLENFVQQEETLMDLENTENMIEDDMEPLRVRLEGGIGDYQGRLSANVDGIWGTVCSRNWTQSEARATCRSLGYETGKVVPSHVIGPGPGLISASDVSCPADADSLDDCEYRVASHSCSHLHDVAVSCSGKQNPDTPASFHRRRQRITIRRRRVDPRISRVAIFGCKLLQCYPNGCQCEIRGPIYLRNILRNPVCFPLLTTTTVAPTTTVPPIALDAPLAVLSTDDYGQVYGRFRFRGVLFGRRYIEALNGFGGFVDYLTYLTSCRLLNAQ